MDMRDSQKMQSFQSKAWFKRRAIVQANSIDELS